MSNCLMQRQISRRIVTILLGRDNPSFEKSTRQVEVSGRDRKMKTSMNTEFIRGYAAKKCCMLRFQRVATKISIYA